MTAQTDTKETVAAAGFAGFMALALGPVGLLLAAIAVGIDRAWTNGVGSGTVPAAARRGWAESVAGHRAWLDWDRQHRARYRAARRRWLADGADPATAPARPGMGSRFGAWLRRLWARTAVTGTEFGAGFADGWRAARKVQDEGGGFADIVRARPEPQPAAVPIPESQPSPVREPVREQARQEPQPAAPPIVPEPPASPPPDPAPAVPAQTAPQASNPTTTRQPVSDQGAAMTAATVGETHADITLAKLDGIGASIGQAENLNDQAAAVASNLDAQVAAASEYADEKGATTASRQALDEARAVAAAIRETVARLADLCERAGESVSAATAGMRPAVDAQDSLNAAGARGDIVATATSD